MQLISDTINGGLNDGVSETKVETKGKTKVETKVKTPDAIVSVLSDHPDWSLQEVALAIEKSLSAVESAVRNMTKEGVLERVGPKKGGTWLVHTTKNGAQSHAP